MRAYQRPSDRPGTQAGRRLPRWPRSLVRVAGDPVGVLLGVRLAVLHDDPVALEHVGALGEATLEHDGRRNGGGLEQGWLVAVVDDRYDGASGADLEVHG